MNQPTSRLATGSGLSEHPSVALLERDIRVIGPVAWRTLVAARTRGSGVLFPSFLAHQVTPVTRGLRRSLVAWAYGPQFC